MNRIVPLSNRRAIQTSSALQYGQLKGRAVSPTELLRQSQAKSLVQLDKRPRK